MLVFSLKISASVQKLKYFIPRISRANDLLRKTGLDEQITINYFLERTMQSCGLYSFGCGWYHFKGILENNKEMLNFCRGYEILVGWLVSWLVRLFVCLFYVSPLLFT